MRLNRVLTLQPPATPYSPLTPAESRVYIHLCEGLSNKEIAERLGKSEPTVKHQVSEILRKHGVHSRARLIALARAGQSASDLAGIR